MKVQVRIDGQAVTRGNDRGRLALFDDGGAFDPVAGQKRIAVIDFRLDESRPEPGLTRALAYLRAPLRQLGVLEVEHGFRADDADTKADRLDRRAVVARGELPGIGGGERRLDDAERGRVDDAGGQRHVDLVHLADEPHVGAAFDADVLRRDAGFDEARAAGALELVEDAVDRRRIETLVQ